MSGSHRRARGGEAESMGGVPGSCPGGGPRGVTVSTGSGDPFTRAGAPAPFTSTKETNMAKINFGGVWEEVVTSEEFPLSRAQEVLKDETVAVLGYGVQGPGQALNLRDNGIRVIVGQREGGATWKKAVEDGFVPGKTLFPVEEAAKRGTVIEYLLSDAGQTQMWPTLKPYLTKGKTLYFSHGFSITYRDQTERDPAPRTSTSSSSPPRVRDARCAPTSSTGAGSTPVTRSSRTPRGRRPRRPSRSASPSARATSSRRPSRRRCSAT